MPRCSCSVLLVLVVLVVLVAVPLAVFVFLVLFDLVIVLLTLSWYSCRSSCSSTSTRCATDCYRYPNAPSASSSNWCAEIFVLLDGHSTSLPVQLKCIFKFHVSWEVARTPSTTQTMQYQPTRMCCACAIRSRETGHPSQSMCHCCRGI